MEKLKNFEDLDKPDQRNLFYRIINTETGDSRKLDITDLYRSVESIKLLSSVPDDVRSQFNVARNLAIYSWFSYSFNQVSELQSFACVEMALRDKVGRHKNGFRGQIKKAVSAGLIEDDGFKVARHSGDTQNTYSESLKDIVPKLRNELAHGSTTLHPGSIFTLQWSADFINQLYKERVD